MPASNTYSTQNLGSAVSNTEDLERGVYLISPSQYPVVANSKKEKCTAVNPEYTLDTYADVDTTAVAEGADSNSFGDAFSEQARVFNYVQTIKRDLQVTDDQELVDSASGVNFAGAVVKGLKELYRSQEAVTLGQQARAISGATRTTAGLAEQLSGSSTIFPSEYQTPTAQVVSASAATESNVDSVLQSVQDTSGDPAKMRIYGGTSWISNFSGNTMRVSGAGDYRSAINFNGEEGNIKNRLRMYEGQHGVVEVMDLNSDTLYDTTNKDMAYFINHDYLVIKELGGLINKELPDLGGGRRVTLRKKFAPCVLNPRAHAYWDALS